MRNGFILLACACAIPLVCTGCWNGGQTMRAPAESAPPGAASRAEEVAEQPLSAQMQKLASMVPAPPFEYEEYEMPPRCVIEDYSPEWAILERTTGLERPANEFLLLDLVTGKYRALDWPLVNEDRGWDRLTVRFANGWIAWEELSPNEGNDMFNAEWRMYVATFDPARCLVGDPVELDGGKTSYRLRPQFGVIANEVIWTRNRVTLSPQETGEFSGRVMARGLPDGVEREMFSSADVIVAMRATDAGLVMTTSSEREGVPEQVLAVRRESGSVVASQTLDLDGPSSHWGDFSDGWLTWSWLPSPDRAWPSLGLSCPDGSLWRVDGNAGDGNIINGFLMYERNRTEGPVGRVKSVREICGVKLATMERFVLCESTEGFWETCVSDEPGSAYVVALDDGAHVTTGGKTLVRRYTLE